MRLLQGVLGGEIMSGGQGASVGNALGELRNAAIKRSCGIYTFVSDDDAID